MMEKTYFEELLERLKQKIIESIFNGTSPSQKGIEDGKQLNVRQKKAIVNSIDEQFEAIKSQLLRESEDVLKNLNDDIVAIDLKVNIFKGKKNRLNVSESTRIAEIYGKYNKIGMSNLDTLEKMMKKYEKYIEDNSEYLKSRKVKVDFPKSPRDILTNLLPIQRFDEIQETLAKRMLDYADVLNSEAMQKEINKHNKILTNILKRSRGSKSVLLSEMKNIPSKLLTNLMLVICIIAFLLEIGIVYTVTSRTLRISELLIRIVIAGGLPFIIGASLELIIQHTETEENKEKFLKVIMSSMKVSIIFILILIPVANLLAAIGLGDENIRESINSVIYGLLTIIFAGGGFLALHKWLQFYMIRKNTRKGFENDLEKLEKVLEEIDKLKLHRSSKMKKIDEISRFHKTDSLKEFDASSMNIVKSIKEEYLSNFSSSALKKIDRLIEDRSPIYITE